MPDAEVAVDCAADGATCFHTDTPTGRIDRCRLDPDTRLPITREPFITAEGPGLPDGFTLDTDGCLWVAFWGGGAVRRYLRTLYVTTARHGLPDPDPREGALFAVTGLAQGRPAHRFPLSRLHGRTA